MVNVLHCIALLALFYLTNQRNHRQPAWPVRQRTENPAKFLTQDQISEFKECFSLHDRERKARIKGQDLMLVMRCLGSNPTPSEVQRHLLSHNVEGAGGELDFSTFLSIMHQQLQQEAPEAEILEAMLMADKEQKGFILASELRAKLTGLGEKLTDKEVDELLKEAGVGSDGRVHCEHFAKAVTHSWLTGSGSKF